jgi:hypothetical protein
MSHSCLARNRTAWRDGRCERRSAEAHVRCVWRDGYCYTHTNIHPHQFALGGQRDQ